MKKYMALAAALLLSSCACFNSSDEEEAYVPAPKKVCAKGDASCNGTRQQRYVRNYDEDVYYRRPHRSSYRILTTEDLGEQAYTRPAPAPIPAPQPPVVQVIERPAPAPVAAPVVVTTPAVVPAPAVVTTSGSDKKCNSCEPTIRETREPVEILYKKVTYKTVYEPKTTEEVTYEKVPYNKAVSDTVVKEVVTTTTTTTSPQTAPVIMTVEERK